MDIKNIINFYYTIIRGDNVSYRVEVSNSENLLNPTMTGLIIVSK